VSDRKTPTTRTAALKTAATKTAAPKTAAPKTAAPKTAAPKTTATVAPTTAEPQSPTRRAPKIEDVRVSEVRISPKAQRSYREAHAAEIAADFDVEAFGYPVVNRRGGLYYCVDGQHRIGALKIMGWDDQLIQCEVYDNLTEKQEADLFLRRDERKAIPALEKYRIALTAEWDDESEIESVVRQMDLTVGATADSIRAVGTLKRVYGRGGPDILGRTLLIIREAYGIPGFESSVIDGVAFVCQRYNGTLDTTKAVKALGNLHGGVNGLLGRAETLRKQTRNPKGVCVAAATVDVINGVKGGKRLTPWWKATS
jgi:hypothetical protein